MLKIPFNAYDNWAATAMKVCLSLGITLSGSGLLSLPYNIDENYRIQMPTIFLLDLALLFCSLCLK